MQCTLLCALLTLVLTADCLPVMETVGTIHSLDADKGIIEIAVNGTTHTVPVAADAKILGADGAPLTNGLKSAELGVGAKVTVELERGALGPVVHSMQLDQHLRNAPAAGRTTIGLKPLTEMTAEDKYKGEDGALYGGGKNEPPPALLAAAKKKPRKSSPAMRRGSRPGMARSGWCRSACPMPPWNIRASSNWRTPIRGSRRRWSLWIARRADRP